MQFFEFTDPSDELGEDELALNQQIQELMDTADDSTEVIDSMTRLGLPDSLKAFITMGPINEAAMTAYLLGGGLCASQDLIDQLQAVNRRAVSKMGEILELVGLALQEAMLTGEALAEDGETGTLITDRVHELNDILDEVNAQKDAGLHEMFGR